MLLPVAISLALNTAFFIITQFVYSSYNHFFSPFAPCRFRGCKNRPALLPGWMLQKATKPGSVYLSLSIVFCVLLFIRATFCIVSLCWYAFCLLVVLVKLSVLAEWLARKTPLWKPNRGEGIISTKPRPNSERDFLGLICCFIVLLYVCLVPRP